VVLLLFLLRAVLSTLTYGITEKQRPVSKYPNPATTA